MEKLKHFTKSQQLTDEIRDDLFSRAEFFEKKVNNQETLHDLDGKIMITLFYEPSTRTRMSFESAMQRLGGRVIGTEAAKLFSSVAKGETLEDTIRVVGKYGDVIVMRHGDDNAAEVAEKYSPVPFINAGSGTNQHPTQALLDIYTIKKELGKLDGLKVAMAGDLEKGRTTHSLSYLLSKYRDNELIFVSPKSLCMKKEIKDYLREKDVKYREENDLNKILPEADIIYMTRIQRERMTDQEKETYKDTDKDYGINLDNFEKVRKDARILHPLPRNREILLSDEIEKNDPRVAYFRQAENGLYTRMALLAHMLTK